MNDKIIFIGLKHEVPLREHSYIKQACEKAYNYYHELFSKNDIKIVVSFTTEDICFRHPNHNSKTINGLCTYPMILNGRYVTPKNTYYLTIRSKRDVYKMIETIFHEFRHVWQDLVNFNMEQDKKYWIRTCERDARSWAYSFFNEHYDRMAIKEMKVYDI